MLGNGGVIASKTIERFCVVCGKSLTGRQRKICSDECRRKRERYYFRKYRLNNPEKRKEIDRNYRLNNLEKVRETKRRYRQKKRRPKFCVMCGTELVNWRGTYCSDKCRKEKIKERARKYYWDNRMTKFCVICGTELVSGQSKLCSDDCRRKRKKEHARKYHLDNPEKIKEHNRKSYLNNLEKRLEWGRKYRQDNAEKIKEDKAKSYRRSRGLPEDWDLSRESSIEVIMKRWLQDLNIGFMEQHSINLKEWGGNWTRADFFIEPNICLYCDGDYYHRLEGRSEHDARINSALETGGYIVIRLFESDILAGVRPVEILELLQ